MPGEQNTYAASAGGNPTDATGGVNGSNPAGGTQKSTSTASICLRETASAIRVTPGRHSASTPSTSSRWRARAISSQYAGQGVENYSVKSGGNQIHGSVYEYIRNTALDAWLGSSKIAHEHRLDRVPSGR